MKEERIIDNMRLVAAVYLFVSAIGAIVIWVEMGTRPKYPTVAYSTMTANWPGIVLGVGCLLSGLLVYFVIGALGIIAASLIRIRDKAERRDP
jgi:hypothetical protein